MSDKSLLCIVAVVSIACCTALELFGTHVPHGPCYTAAVAVGALAALAWAGRAPPGPPPSALADRPPHKGYSETFYPL